MFSDNNTDTEYFFNIKLPLNKYQDHKIYFFCKTQWHTFRWNYFSNWNCSSCKWKGLAKPVADLHRQTLDSRPSLSRLNFLPFSASLGDFGRIIGWRSPLGIGSVSWKFWIHQPLIYVKLLQVTHQNPLGPNQPRAANTAPGTAGTPSEQTSRAQSLRPKVILRFNTTIKNAEIVVNIIFIDYAQWKKTHSRLSFLVSYQISLFCLICFTQYYVNYLLEKKIKIYKICTIFFNYSEIFNYYIPDANMV